MFLNKKVAQDKEAIDVVIFTSSNARPEVELPLLRSPFLGYRGNCLIGIQP